MVNSLLCIAAQRYKECNAKSVGLKFYYYVRFLKPFCRRKSTYGFVLLSKIVLGVIPFRYVPNSFPNIETVYILIIIYCFFDFSEAYNVPCIW